MEGPRRLSGGLTMLHRITHNKYVVALAVLVALAAASGAGLKWN